METDTKAGRHGVAGLSDKTLEPNRTPATRLHAIPTSLLPSAYPSRASHLLARYICFNHNFSGLQIATNYWV